MLREDECNDQEHDLDIDPSIGDEDSEKYEKE